jgi:3-phenylpropionate/cinnamic acid dioxygenase small subunit
MRRSLPFTDERHQRAHHFLVEEAACLDGHDFDGWLSMLTDDVRYRVPVTVTAMRSTEPGRLATMDHLDEDRWSLAKRVARLDTDHAWTEDPRSRIRHLVTNVRTFAADVDGELDVESSLLLFRSRGDTRAPELVCASRHDRLRDVDGELRLAERVVHVDEAVLRTQNLAIFL